MKHLDHARLHAIKRDFTVIDGTTYQVTYQTQSASFSNVIGYTTASGSATSASGSATSASSSNGRFGNSASSSTATTSPSVSSSDASAESTTVAAVSQISQQATQQATQSQTTAYSLQTSPTAANGTPFSTGQTYSATPSSTSSSDPTLIAGSSGTSSGGKIGIIVGLIAVIAMILGLCLFCLNRRKRQVKVQQARADAEKVAALEALKHIKTKPQAAPRLSLRPASSFLPEFMGVRRKSRLSAGNMLGTTPETNAMRERYLNGGTSAQVIQMNEKQPVQENPFKDPENPFVDSIPQAKPPVKQERVTVPEPVEPVVPLAMPEPEAIAAPLPVQTHNEMMPAPAVAAPAQTPAQQDWKQLPENTFEMAAAEVPAPLIPSKPAARPAEVPGSVVQPPSVVEDNVYRIMMDFVPSMGDELELKAGQVVRMLHEYDDGWCLCTRLDRSAQGVVPRSCLGKRPAKPRPAPQNQNGRPMSPAMRGPPVHVPNGRSAGPQGRPMSPAMMQRPQSPAQQRPASPGLRNMPPAQQRAIQGQDHVGMYNSAPRPLSPNERPVQQRSQSPGPYSAQGRPQMAQGQRRRSNSAANVRERRASPPGPSQLGNAF